MRRSPTLRRALLATLLLATTAAPAAAVAPAPAVAPADHQPGLFAWAVVTTPELASYVPDADHAFVPAGNALVTRTQKGGWRVTFTGLAVDEATNGGVAHAVALGTEPRVCWVRSWSRLGETVRVNVGCRWGSNLIDTPFVVTWTYHANPYTPYNGYRSGYAWMNLAESSGALNTGYQAMTAGGTVKSTRTSEGTYTVAMPGVSATEHVLISPWGKDRPCRPMSWTTGTTGLKVQVECRQLDGDISDERFTILVGRNVSVAGPGYDESAYAVVRTPKLAEYTVAAADGFSFSGEPITVKRAGVGVWTVRFAGMPAGGAAIVTPLGGTAICQVGSLPRTDTHLRIGVRCFTPAGVPVDAKFVVSWGGPKATDT
ncbi:MAG: hypothetical protein ACKOTZ_01495 [Chloroflexota bacterium]